jgi:Coenzyme PQQ synthesis protein D (PqqD)
MTTVYARNPSIETAPLQDEIILFDPNQSRFCVLNRTASFLWNQLATALTTDAVAAEVCGGFSGVAMEVVLADTDRTLQQLLSLKFVVDEPGEPRNERADKKMPPSLPVGSGPSDLPKYESPVLTVMNEDEVLSAFQVPVVATTWWG